MLLVFRSSLEVVLVVCIVPDLFDNEKGSKNAQNSLRNLQVIASTAVAEHVWRLLSCTDLVKLLYTFPQFGLFTLQKSFICWRPEQRCSI